MTRRELFGLVAAAVVGKKALTETPGPYRIIGSTYPEITTVTTNGAIWMDFTTGKSEQYIGGKWRPLKSREKR